MDWETTERLASWAAALGASILATIFARRQSKEDSNLHAISTAVSSWRDIAESNKDHWDECEAKTDKLERQVSIQAVEILELKSQVNLLMYKLERYENGI